MAFPKIKRYILLAAVLSIYVVAIAMVGLPHYRETGNWVEFWIIAAASETVVLLLALVLKRRDALREKRKQPPAPRT